MRALTYANKQDPNEMLHQLFKSLFARLTRARRAKEIRPEPQLPGDRTRRRTATDIRCEHYDPFTHWH